MRLGKTMRQKCGSEIPSIQRLNDQIFLLFKPRRLDHPEMYIRVSSIPHFSSFQTSNYQTKQINTSFYTTQTQTQTMHPTIVIASAVEDKNGPLVRGDSGPGTTCKFPDLLHHLIRCRHRHVNPLARRNRSLNWLGDTRTFWREKLCGIPNVQYGDGVGGIGLIRVRNGVLGFSLWTF